MGKSTISMAIFHCYVSSPEGMFKEWWLRLWMFNFWMSWCSIARDARFIICCLLIVYDIYEHWMEDETHGKNRKNATEDLGDRWFSNPLSHFVQPVLFRLNAQVLVGDILALCGQFFLTMCDRLLRSWRQISYILNGETTKHYLSIPVRIPVVKASHNVVTFSNALDVICHIFKLHSYRKNTIYIAKASWMAIFFLCQSYVAPNGLGPFYRRSWGASPQPSSDALVECLGGVFRFFNHPKLGFLNGIPSGKLT